MKFTLEVIAALNVLRHAAENDFERHRLDVLERDLTAPPTVEVIDNTHQRFNGVIYTQNNCGHFCKSQSAIHRVIWAYYHGEIPVGDYDIHHVDGNKSNNNINNLQLLTASEYHSLHTAKPSIEKVCPTCGKNFIVPYKWRKQIYCSLSCRDIGKRKNYPKKRCVICGKKFIVNSHYPKKQTCSSSCRIKLAILKSGYDINCPRKCVICGKEFTPRRPSSPIRTCSRHCGAILAHKTRESNKEKN